MEILNKKQQSNKHNSSYLYLSLGCSLLCNLAIITYFYDLILYLYYNKGLLYYYSGKLTED